MIPATGWEAHIEHRPQGKDPWTEQLPVAAWSDDGDAMVVSHRSGALVPARSFKGFTRLAPVEHPVIAVLPGGGWLMTFTEKGETWTEPVLGWTVTSEGVTHPLSADSDGWVEDVRDISNMPVFSHPDRTKVSPVTPSPTEAADGADGGPR